MEPHRLILATAISLCIGSAPCLAKTLENTLGYVVTVCAVRNSYMKIELAAIRKAAQHFLDALDVEVAYLIRSILDVVDANRPARQIHRNIRQRILHRQGTVAVSCNALFVA